MNGSLRREKWRINYKYWNWKRKRNYEGKGIENAISTRGFKNIQIFLFAKKGREIFATLRRIWKYSRLARKLEYKDVWYRYLIYAKSLKIFNIQGIYRKKYTRRILENYEADTIIFPKKNSKISDIRQKILKYETPIIRTSGEKLRNIRCICDLSNLFERIWKSTRYLIFQNMFNSKTPEGIANDRNFDTRY